MRAYVRLPIAEWGKWLDGWGVEVKETLKCWRFFVVEKKFREGKTEKKKIEKKFPRICWFFPFFFSLLNAMLMRNFGLPSAIPPITQGFWPLLESREFHNVPQMITHKITKTRPRGWNSSFFHTSSATHFQPTRMISVASSRCFYLSSISFWSWKTKKRCINGQRRFLRDPWC